MRISVVHVSNPRHTQDEGTILTFRLEAAANQQYDLERVARERELAAETADLRV